MYFEDYVPGLKRTLTSVTVTEADIIDFALRFDPQPFHTDPASPEAAPYGGVIAAGWQICALTGHALVTEFLSRESSLPSPGVDEVRWHAPVRAGDVLTWEATVVEARQSRSKHDRGIVRTLVQASNQDGATVTSMTFTNIIRRHPEP